MRTYFIKLTVCSSVKDLLDKVHSVLELQPESTDVSQLNHYDNVRPSSAMKNKIMTIES